MEKENKFFKQIPIIYGINDKPFTVKRKRTIFKNIQCKNL